MVGIAMSEIRPLEVLLYDLPSVHKARRHRNVAEAKAMAQIEREKRTEGASHGVVATTDHQRPELYGWANPVRTHIDSTTDRYMYLGVLLSGRKTTLGLINPETGSISTLRLEPGMIVRMNDRYPHWTEGGGLSVALHLGCFIEPDDYRAGRILASAARRLASGSRLPPRIRATASYPRDDEVFADGIDRAPILPVSLAKRIGWPPVTCALCSQPAIIKDDQWPYNQELNRCRTHLGQHTRRKDHG